MDTIVHRTLSRPVEAGAVRGAHVIGQVRLFKKIDTLVACLVKIGQARFDVDSSNYEPDALSGRRPDWAEALRRTFAAAAAHEAGRDAEGNKR